MAWQCEAGAARTYALGAFRSSVTSTSSAAASFCQRDDRRVAAALLRLRDVRALEAGQFGESLLGEAAFGTQLAQPLPVVHEFWLLFPHGTSVSSLGSRVYGT